MNELRKKKIFWKNIKTANLIPKFSDSYKKACIFSNLH